MGRDSGAVYERFVGQNQADGQSRLIAAAGNGLVGASAWKELGRRLGLSPREVQIVCRLCAGQKEFTIAVALGISPYTVHTHFARMYRKLGVANHVELLVRLFTKLLALAHAPASPLPPLCPHRAAGRCPWP